MIIIVHVVGNTKTCFNVYSVVISGLSSVSFHQMNPNRSVNLE